jgi:murein DD-endopeptidase MepM/ murein hydrolase activator NlpD
VNLQPPQVSQGHTLWIEVLANRPITVTGTLDERPLFFVVQSARAWAVTGVPVAAAPGTHAVHLSIADGLGANVSTTVPVTVVEVDFGSEHIDVAPDRENLLDPEVLRQEAQRLDEVFAHVTPRQLWEGIFIWPHVGPVTSPFGMSRTYDGRQSGYHGGVDISGDVGASIVAASSGRVALAAPLQVRGSVVILDHGWGVYSGYYHLSNILVTEGQEVSQGQPVGQLGNTGLSTGAHLHWEMRVGGVLIDPVEWTTRLIPE